MNKSFKPGEELISLNEELHTEFAIVELEERLETDPMLLSGVLGRGESLMQGMCSDDNQLCLGAYLDPCDSYIKPENDGESCPVCHRVM